MHEIRDSFVWKSTIPIFMKFGGSVHAQGAYVRTRTRSSFISQEKESNVGREQQVCSPRRISKREKCHDRL